MALSSLDCSVSVKASWNATKSLELTTLRDQGNTSKSVSFTLGTGSTQCDLLFHDRRIVAASGTDSIDLNGALQDAFQDDVDFAKIKAIVIVNRSDEDCSNPNHSATDAQIKVAPGSSNGFDGPFVGGSSGGVNIDAGSAVSFTSTTGWTVTADTGDILEITNNDSEDEAMYDIYILGTSA